MTATDLAKPVLGGTRVLVAEGDTDDSAALTAVLRLNGFDAREARTAGEAFRAVRDSRPAVLITDLDLPGDDGYALIRRVRRLPDPPVVVVVTAHSTEAARRAATEAGAAAYLLKPAQPVKIVELVMNLCASRDT